MVTSLSTLTMSFLLRSSLQDATVRLRHCQREPNLLGHLFVMLTLERSEQHRSTLCHAGSIPQTAKCPRHMATHDRVLVRAQGSGEVRYGGLIAHVPEGDGGVAPQHPHFRALDGGAAEALHVVLVREMEQPVEVDKWHRAILEKRMSRYLTRRSRARRTGRDEVCAREAASRLVRR